MNPDWKEEMITIRLDRSLKAKMDERQEINWSGVARKDIRTTIENLETMEEIVAGFQLTEEAREIVESITESSNSRARPEREEEDRSKDCGTVATH